MKKLKLLFEFYKSTLPVNLIIIIISLLGGAESIFINLCVLGTLIIYIFKEFYRKNEYYFYFNNNVSILELYGFYFVVNLCISIVIFFINYLV